MSTIEDKIVQGALREVLEAVYEQDFVECSCSGYVPSFPCYGYPISGYWLDISYSS